MTHRILGLSCALLVGLAGCAPSAAPPKTTDTPPSPPLSATSFRVESSLGVQIEVPSHWAVNDYGCNMTDGPSVVRGVGVQTMCLTPEKPTKEVAIIGTPAETQAQLAELGATAPRRVQLGDVDAERGEARAPDGRHVGWLRVSSRSVTVLVKARTPGLVQRILDSAKLAAVDTHGCPARRPVPQAGTAAGAATPFAPENPSSISVCYYGDNDRLKSSASLSGERAVALARSLNAAPAGATPDADPNQCLHPAAPPPPDAVLFVHAGAAPSKIFVSFSGCVGRKLDNGARQARVNEAIVRAFMEPLRTGYAHQGDL
jgi:hypothetical protein